MARRRFFVPGVSREHAELTGTDAEHLVRVLRVQPGQLFEISDNQRAYLAEVESARKSSVVFHIREELPPEPQSVHITLCAAMIKFDRYEWLLEKATELGVACIRPFSAERTDHGLGQAAEKRVDRWRKIAVEASQQSRRTHLPEIHPPLPSIEALELTGTILLLDEDQGAPPILPVIQASPQAESISLLLGPEGGWTEGEREHAVACGARACSLGQRILRTETAGIAALAIVQAAFLTPAR